MTNWGAGDLNRVAAIKTDTDAFDAWTIELGGVELSADRSGVLFLAVSRTLIVADLHLEKGTSLARRRALLPPYDTRSTLRRLALAMERLGPKTVIALGDSFHDSEGAARLCEEDRARLAALQRGRDWLWIAGNHDPKLPVELGGERADDWRCGGVVFRHEPSSGVPPHPNPLPTGERGRLSRGSAPRVPSPRWGEGQGEGAAEMHEVAGHLHPCARVSRSGHTQRRPCFAFGGGRLILPAFGAYTGGLNVLDAAIAGLFAAEYPAIAVLGRSGVYPVARHQLRPD
jgi:uncharacterized protein